MQKSNFEGRFLSKLSKIDKQEIENFLGNVVREKNFLEIVFNAMLDGIIVLRSNLEVLYTNNAALDLLGISPRRKVINERIASLVRTGEFTELVARFAINRERIVNSEVEIDLPQQRSLFVTFIPIEDGGDPANASVIIIIHDVTQAKRHELEKQKASQATRLATLTAGLAHEIKNPLNSLNIHAQLLQKGLRDIGDKSKKVDRQRLTQSSEIIVEEIKRLSGVVDTFLHAVRPTRPLVQKGNINRLVERVAATMRPEVEACGAGLIVRLEHDIPPVEFDPTQMTQALINLVKNSIDALCQPDEEQSPPARILFDEDSEVSAVPSEPRARRVELRTELAEKEFLIRVIDNGKGIPENHLKQIFEPYFTTKFSGTGLGLAIVSRIVSEHQGKIGVDSQPGVGTAITLAFPLDSRPVRLLGGDAEE